MTVKTSLYHDLFHVTKDFQDKVFTKSLQVIERSAKEILLQILLWDDLQGKGKEENTQSERHEDNIFFL